MAVSKFKFVSPGVQIAEIDNSQIPRVMEEMGPIIIGRSERGPSLRPVKVGSYSEFVEVFGNPAAGGKGDDVWRDGGYGLAPTYGVYAAQAYLRNSNPVTFVRLLGKQSGDATAAGYAGWTAGDISDDRTGGAYGLFVIDQGTSVASETTSVQTFTFAGPPGASSEGRSLIITGSNGVIYNFTASAIAMSASNVFVWNSGEGNTAGAESLAALFNASASAAFSASSAAGVCTVKDTFEGTLAAARWVFNVTGALGGSGSLLAVTSSLTTAGANANLAANSGTTGSLAAVFYLTTGSMSLRGVDIADTNREISGTCTLVQTDASGDFKIEIRSESGAETERVSFSLGNENNKNYIRKAFNTNPTLTNSSVTPSSAVKTYWLGESYTNQCISSSCGSRFSYTAPKLGILLPLISSSAEQNEQQRSLTKAKSPWVISQDLAGVSSSFSYQKLFQFETLEGGEWEQSNFKVSISDVKGSDDPYNPYGSFTVELRMAKDSDNSKQIVERYSLCNLNPTSKDFVAKKIGDMYANWSDTERRYREYGNFPNQSKYVRVSLNSEVNEGTTNATFLPFGYEGPLRFKTFEVTASSTGSVLGGVGQTSGTLGGFVTAQGNRFVAGSNTSPENDRVTGSFRVQFSQTPSASFSNATCSFAYPIIPLRQNSTQGNLGSPKDAYFGIDTTMGSSTRFENTYKDLVRAFASDFDAQGSVSTMCMERPYVFTLEDLSRWTDRGYDTQSTGEVYYISGSRAEGQSISTTGSAASGDTTGWNGVLKAGFDAFTLPLVGGFNGLDITEIDPFRNTGLADKSPSTSYAYNSIKMAVDTCADPEVIECNMMTMPGLINTALTEHIIKTCEDRADSLAIIDIQNGYTPSSENASSEEDRAGSVDSAVSNLSQRGLNSSYACCYYPWVQARDSETGNTFWCPPSVAAIGTFSSAQQRSELWFAPAGFNRGGLTEGSAGIPVVNVKQKLTSKQRDSLYEVNINPIASFPAEGIVIFGQKTLQTTPSALDRVNVRRLMIYVKKEISRIAATLLFDQNVQVTWDRFTGQVVPFLNSILSRLGLSDFRVILDESTTTPDLIDRNILYAKIFLKPARAIEFIAIDFVITSTGASFQD